MKAFVTVIDDNGNVIYKDKLLEPVREEVILNPYEPPIKEARYSFVVKHLVDFDIDKVKDFLKRDDIDNLIVDHTCEEGEEDGK